LALFSCVVAGKMFALAKANKLVSCEASRKACLFFYCGIYRDLLKFVL
jgi:hypothetical protein